MSDLSKRVLRDAQSLARLLLDAARSGLPMRARLALRSLRSHPYLAKKSVDELLAVPKDVKLKHAQFAVASALGYEDWRTLERELVPADPTAAEVRQDVLTRLASHEGSEEPLILTLREIHAAQVGISDVPADVEVGVEGIRVVPGAETFFCAGGGSVFVANVFLRERRRFWRAPLPIEDYFSVLSRAAQRRAESHKDLEAADLWVDDDVFELSFHLVTKHADLLGAHVATERLLLSLTEAAESLLFQAPEVLEHALRVDPAIASGFAVHLPPVEPLPFSEKSQESVLVDLWADYEQAREEGEEDPWFEPVDVDLNVVRGAHITANDLPPGIGLSIWRKRYQLDPREGDYENTFRVVDGHFTCYLSLAERTKYWGGPLALPDYMRYAHKFLQKQTGVTVEPVLDDGDFLELLFKLDTGKESLLDAYNVGRILMTHLRVYLEALSMQASEALGTLTTE